MLRAYRVRRPKSLRLSGKRKYYLHQACHWMEAMISPFHGRSEREKTRTLFARLLLRQIYVNSRLTKCLFASHFYLLRNRHVIRGGRTVFFPSFVRFFVLCDSMPFVHSVWLEHAAAATAATHSFIFLSFLLVWFVNLLFLVCFGHQMRRYQNFFPRVTLCEGIVAKFSFIRLRFGCVARRSASRRMNGEKMRTKTMQIDGQQFTLGLSRRRRCRHRRRIHRFWAHCAQYATTKRNQDCTQTENEINMNLILEYFSWHFAFSFSFVDNLLLVLQFSAGFCRFCHYP